MYGLEWEEIIQRLEERYEIEELVEVLDIVDILEQQYGTNEYFHLTVREVCKLNNIKRKIQNHLHELDIV